MLNPLSERPPPLSSDEISAAALLAELAPCSEKALIFRYEGRDVLPGYHVTEVKSGAFQALDCGANFESWHETFVQLWDAAADEGASFMPVAKFLAIIRKVTERIPFDPNAKLTFELSDGVSAIQLYRAASVEIADDVVFVELKRRPASCKPYDRLLEQQNRQQALCCGTDVNTGRGAEIGARVYRLAAAAGRSVSSVARACVRSNWSRRPQ
jgi:hypothetical protein